MNEIQELKEKVKNLKVLFVDDEAEVRNSMNTFLTKFFNKVTICSDGEEGLESFMKQEDFDIIITDIVMPKLNGIEMINQIKQINPDIFVVFITASRNPPVFKLSKNDLCIQKPISFKDIIFIIKNVEDLK